MNKPQEPGLLLVANWDSNVGYAWWLMESFWQTLSRLYEKSHTSYLAYPSISTVPAVIQDSQITTLEFDFTKTGLRNVLKQCQFIRKKNIRTIYFTDQAIRHWRYFLFRLCGVDIIVTHDHTPGTRTRPQGFKRLIKRILGRSPLINVDAIVCVTPYVAQRATEVACLPSKKVFIASNGLPQTENQGTANLDRRFEIPDNSISIITTGRANRYKGIDFAIDVIAKLVNEYGHRNLYWVFCGDGPDLERFRKNAKDANIQNNTLFPGKCNEVNKMLASFDIAFHPSYGEVGYSLSILEYMRAGLPVVLSNNPSVCGANTDNVDSLIYQEHDIDSACEKLLTLITKQDLLDKLGNNARKTAEKYTLDNTHNELTKAFSAIDPSLGITGNR